MKDSINKLRVLVKKYSQPAMITLTVIGIFVALYLTYTRVTHNQLVCVIGSCERVQSSQFALFLGIPVAYLGVVYYLVMFVLLYKKFIPLQILWALWGVLFSSYLTSTELFIIHYICMWCMTSYTLILLITGIMCINYDLHSVRSWRIHFKRTNSGTPEKN